MQAILEASRTQPQTSVTHDGARHTLPAMKALDGRLDAILDGSLLALEEEIEAVRADLKARGIDDPLVGSEGVRVGRY